MGKSKAPARRTHKHLRKLRAMDRETCAAFFEDAPLPDLIEIVEESYAHDLVNLWLDLKRSTVRDVAQRLVKQRKRLMRPILALYHYKEYLTNPLPLVLTAVDGEEMPNYYGLTGLTRDANPEDVKEARRLLLQAYEEENFAPADRKAAAARREELRDAFAVLAHEGKRAAADTRLPNMPYFYPRRDQCWLEAMRRYA